MKMESYSNVQNQEVHEMKQQWNTVQPEQREGPTSMMDIGSTDVQPEWQPQSLPSNIQDTYDRSEHAVHEKQRGILPVSTDTAAGLLESRFLLPI